LVEVDRRHHRRRRLQRWIRKKSFRLRSEKKISMSSQCCSINLPILYSLELRKPEVLKNFDQIKCYTIKKKFDVTHLRRLVGGFLVN
jgi:hypothetical protein